MHHICWKWNDVGNILTWPDACMCVFIHACLCTFFGGLSESTLNHLSSFLHVSIGEPNKNLRFCQVLGQTFFLFTLVAQFIYHPAIVIPNIKIVGLWSLIYLFLETFHNMFGHDSFFICFSGNKCFKRHAPESSWHWLCKQQQEVNNPGGCCHWKWSWCSTCQKFQERKQ